MPWHAYNSIAKVDSTPSSQRPPSGPGSNFLLVGSDSRDGLSKEEKERLAASTAEGARTDSIILIHKSRSGKNTILSIPRDSYVEIPGHGHNKINAAFFFGGPKLLVETVELATGVHIDGYLEIGFAGFADVVDALGGVTMCAPFDMNDPQAGINLKKGCQHMNGPTALGFVRARYSDPRGDIGRAERQRQFLGAIMKETVTPSTILWPPKYFSTTMAIAGQLTIGKDTSKWDLGQAFFALRSIGNGGGVSMVVPISTASMMTSAGMSIKWDEAKSQALFEALRKDTPISEPLPGTDGIPTGG